MQISLFFRDSGSGPALIILHGIFGSGENWLTVAKKFADQFRVFLPDQRNHGRSPHSDEFDYDVLAEDLLHFADSQHLDKFFLIGHSMGGKVAMQFAQKHPGRLHALVVADIAPRRYPPHHRTILEGMKAIDLEHFTSRNQADEAMARFIPETDVRQFLLKNLYRNDAGNFAWRLNLPVLEKAAETIGENPDAAMPCPVPALFIRGGLSSYIRKEDEAEILRRFPSAEISTVEGAGHWVHAEKPEEFSEMVLKFFHQHLPQQL